MFKVGDIVKCVNIVNIYSLTLNKKYKIEAIFSDGDIVIKNDINEKTWYMPYRFRLDLSKQREEKLSKICSNQAIK